MNSVRKIVEVRSGVGDGDGLGVVVGVGDGEGVGVAEGVALGGFEGVGAAVEHGTVCADAENPENATLSSCMVRYSSPSVTNIAMILRTSSVLYFILLWSIDSKPCIKCRKGWAV